MNKIRQFLFQILLFLVAAILSIITAVLSATILKVVLGVLAVASGFIAVGWLFFEIGHKANRQVVVIENEAELYRAAINLIKQQTFATIRIYAPVGFWQESNHKIRWFYELNEYLKRNINSELLMVFGVPDWPAGYQHMEKTLEGCFGDCDSAIIRYIPPRSRKRIDEFPTIGMITFDTYATTLGLGIRESYEKADTAWVMVDEHVTRTANRWFDKHVWTPNEKNAIKGINLPLSNGFTELQRKYKTTIGLEVEP